MGHYAWTAQSKGVETGRESELGIIEKSLNMSHQAEVPLPISDEKALFLAELGQAVNELNLVLTGRLPARDAEQLIDELSYPEPNGSDG